MITRAYNTITCDSAGILCKRSTDPKLLDEIEYYRNIPDDLSILFPRVLWHKMNSPGTLYLEKYGYPLLANLLVNDDGEHSWRRIVEEIELALYSMAGVKCPLDANTSRKIQHEMYIDKTEKYYDAYKAQVGMTRLITDDLVIVNGQTCFNFHKVWPLVKIELDSIINSSSQMIHGDMCFSNLFRHPDVGIKMIDMRGSFGSVKGIWGDVRYDIAKLMHSLDGGYDYLIRNQYSITNDDDENVTSWKVNLPSTLSRLKATEQFTKQILAQYDASHIKLIQGTIFIGMCSRHYDNTIRQTAMYLTGIRLLNEGMVLCT